MGVELLSRNQPQTGVQRWLLLLQHSFAAMKFHSDFTKIVVLGGEWGCRV
jgi:hypothetical protein